MLTAEPDAARAVVAAAAGPARAQLAALAAALCGGAVLGLAAPPSRSRQQVGGEGPRAGLPQVTAAAADPGVLAAGLPSPLSACSSARRRARCATRRCCATPGSLLSTLAVVVLALASGVSPASAAISRHSAQATGPLAAHWPGPGSLLGAVCLVIVTWAVSVIAGTRRDTWSVSSS